MFELFKVFILSTLVVNLWTAFILVQDKRGYRHLNCWFAAFLVALSAPQMDNYAALVVTQDAAWRWKLSLVASSFLWLKGPFIWIFLNALTRKSVSLGRVWPHFVPWLCALTVLLGKPQSGQIIMFMGMAHMMGYLSCAIWRFIRARRSIAQLWSGFKNSAYYWLLYILLGLMSLVAIDFVVMSLVSLGVMAGYSLLDYWVFPAFSVFALSIGVLSVYRPELWFQPEPALNTFADPLDNSTAAAQDITTADSALAAQGENKERHLSLDASSAQSLAQQLTQLMEHQHLYRQSDLSLPGLAAALNVSVHHLSELLNVHLGRSFYDFLNEYRLAQVCRMLSDPTCQLRVLDIAFEAGFNNKNSFNRVFKANQNLTPTQYRIAALGQQTA